jgi:hypothetical protein
LERDEHSDGIIPSYRGTMSSAGNAGKNPYGWRTGDRLSKWRGTVRLVQRGTDQFVLDSA